MKEIFILHGVPKNIISDRDTMFTSKFSKYFFVGLGIELSFSTMYHPQMDRQTKGVNRVLVLDIGFNSPYVFFDMD